MANLNLQINARGTNVSAQRRNNNVVIDIDNTAAEAATIAAGAATATALAAATSVQQIGEQVEADAAAALDPVNGELAKRVRTDTPNQSLSSAEKINVWINTADKERDIKSFGWPANGTQFDDTYVEQAGEFLASGGRLINRDPDAVFLPSVKLEVPSTAGIVDLDFGGARVRHEFNGQLFSATAPYLDAQPATIAPSTDDLSKGSTATPSDTSVITISDTTGYVPGSQIKIWSDDLTAGVRASDGNRRAEYQRVAKVISSTQIETYQRLRDTYTTNVMVARLDTSKRFIMRNGILDASDASLAYQNGAFIVTGYWNPVIQNMRSVHSQDQFLRLVGCMDIDVYGTFGRDLTTDADPAKAAGYLLALVACQGGQVTHMQGSNLRHGFTTSPGRVSDAQLADRARDYNRGKTRDVNVVGMRGYNCQGAFIDCHDDGENNAFSGGHFQYAYNGPRNTDYAVGLRGMRNRAHNIHCEGGGGVWLFTDATDGTVMGGHELGSISWRYGPNQQKEAYGLRVSGNATNPVSGNVVRGFTSESAGVQWGHVRIAYGDVTIIEPEGKCSFLTGGTGKYARIGASATLKTRGGRFDFTGTPSGASARLALWDSDADNNSTVSIDRAEIVSPAISAIAALFDGNGKVGTATAFGVRSNLRTGNPEGNTGFAAGSRISVDLTTTGATSTQPATLPDYVKTTTGWTQNVDLAGRGQSIVYVPFAINVGTATNGRMLDMTPPAYDGQIAVIHNRRTSNDTMRIIKSSSTNLTLVADVTLAIGGSYRVVGLAGKWVDAL